MVEGGSVLFFRLDFVEFLDPPMNAIIDRLVKALDYSPTSRAFFPYDLDAGRVNDFSHGSLL
jgi:hypothetical protein